MPGGQRKRGSLSSIKIQERQSSSNSYNLSFGTSEKRVSEQLNASTDCNEQNHFDLITIKTEPEEGSLNCLSQIEGDESSKQTSDITVKQEQLVENIYENGEKKNLNLFDDEESISSQEHHVYNLYEDIEFTSVDTVKIEECENWDDSPSCKTDAVNDITQRNLGNGIRQGNLFKGVNQGNLVKDVEEENLENGYIFKNQVCENWNDSPSCKTDKVNDVKQRNLIKDIKRINLVKETKQINLVKGDKEENHENEEVFKIQAPLKTYQRKTPVRKKPSSWDRGLIMSNLNDSAIWAVAEGSELSKVQPEQEQWPGDNERDKDMRDFDILGVEQPQDSDSDQSSEEDSHSVTDLSSGSDDFYQCSNSDVSSDEVVSHVMKKRKNKSSVSFMPIHLQAGPSSAPHVPPPATSPAPPRSPPGSPPGQPPSSPSQPSSPPKTPPGQPPSPLKQGKRQSKATWVRVYPQETPLDVRCKFKQRNPGPRHTNGCIKPIDFFMLFMTEQIWLMMVRATNSFAASTIENMLNQKLLRPRSRITKWIDVTVAEMKKFVGILINMGMAPRQTLSSYWSTNVSKLAPFYSQVMTLDRFKLIFSNFQVVMSPRQPPTKGQPGYDPWVKVRGFIDTMNDAFKQHFIPFQEIRIDESMISTKNGCAFIQYMPNKRHSRYGIKKFELCDSRSGYTLQSLFFSGSNFLEGPDPFTKKVVTELLNKVGLLNKGYHLFTDNFYTKFPLVKFLCNHKTYLTSTINKRSRLLSRVHVQVPLQVGESIFFRRRNALLVTFKERKHKKPVFLLTTAVHAENVTITNRKNSNHAVVKPLLFHRYNQFLGGIDSKDKSFYHLGCTRMTKQFWKKIVYNFFEMALYNAHVLFKFHSNRDMDREIFMDEIVNSLCFPNDALQQVGGDGVDSETPVASKPEPTGDYHRCENLPKRNSRLCAVCKMRSRSWCPACRVGVHQKCYRDFVHLYLGRVFKLRL